MTDEPGAAAPAEVWLSTNIRERRDARGLSQTDVARAMAERGHRWHQATQYKIEAGTRPLNVHEAVALAQVLGTDLNVLLAEPQSARRAWRIKAARSVVVSRFAEAVKALESLSRAHDELEAQIASSSADGIGVAQSDEVLLSNTTPAGALEEALGHLAGEQG